MTWATRITIFRLVLIPVFAVLVFLYQFVAGWKDLHWPAFGVFCLAAVSDFFDGFLARYFHQQSDLGALLDPVADKCLLLVSLVTLGLMPLVWPASSPRLPGWFALLIIGRDALLLTGFFILHRANRGKVVIHPHWTGKISTLATFSAVGAVLLAWSMLIQPLAVIGAISAAICTLVYIGSGLHQLRYGPHALSVSNPNPAP